MKPPPQHDLAERWTLGAMLLDNRVIDDVRLVVSPEDFYRDDHAAICRAVFELRDRSQPADAATLDVLLSGFSHDRHRLEMAEALMGSVAHTLDAPYHASIVRDKATKRRLIEAAESIRRACYEDDQPAPSLVDLAESEVFAIAEREATGGTVEAFEAADESIARLQARRPGGFNGVATGLGDLDEMLDGLRPRQLVVLAARPSIGKTALALNVCEHASILGGRSALFVSLEMARAELADRLLSSRGLVDGHRLRTGRATTPGELARMRRARDEMSRASLAIDDAPVRTMGQIAAGARRRKHRRGLDLLVIDYLQLIDAQPQKGESRQEQVARLSRRLKALAKEAEVPVLALSQLNRNSEGREDRRPRLSDLRESGQVEQDADVVLLLHRPEFYDPNDKPGEAELIVAKNRNGPTGTVRLAYRKEFTRFEGSYPEPAAGDDDPNF